MTGNWVAWRGDGLLNLNLVVTFYIALRSNGSTVANWYVIAKLITGAEEYMACTSEDEAREWVKQATGVGYADRQI
jgi:hypothetical protein